jgi:hypothetical protein
MHACALATIEEEVGDIWMWPSFGKYNPASAATANTTYYLPLTTYYLLPTTYYLLPTHAI